MPLCTVIGIERVVATGGGRVGESALAQVGALLGDLLDIP
ncbi:hypothetical protein BH20ACT4_BH20ACT4_04400 [soil metagenome]